MPECSLVQNLIPCFLTFVALLNSIPTYVPFEFLFFIILVYSYSIQRMMILCMLSECGI